MTPKTPLTIVVVLVVVIAAASSSLIGAMACTRAPRVVHPIAAAPIEGDVINDRDSSSSPSSAEGTSKPLGSDLELPLDDDVFPTVIHGIADFRIADTSIVDGTIIPTQGLVLYPHKTGATTANLRGDDGRLHTITIRVKPLTFRGDEVIELRVGETRSLLFGGSGDDVVIEEWAASPTTGATVSSNANGRGATVTAHEEGEITLLLRADGGARLVRLWVSPSNGERVKVFTDGGAGDGGSSRDAAAGSLKERSLGGRPPPPLRPGERL